MKQPLEQVIAEVLRVPESEITDELTMENIEAWDSLKHMDLIVSLEQNFNTELTFDEIIIMTSVAAIRQVLYHKGIIENCK